MPPPLDSPILIASRPQIELTGSRSPFVERQLLQLAITQSDEGLSTLELELLNWQSEGSGQAAGFAFEDEALLMWGTPIRVKLPGTDGQLATAFEGEIHAQELIHPGDQAPRLVVLAEDRLARLRLQRRNARYERQTASAVVEQIARNHGLSAQIDGAFGATLDWLQLGETDLGYARRLCAQHGKRLRLDDRTLHVEPGTQTGGSPGQQPLALQADRDFTQLRILADLAHQRTAVVASGFDLRSGEAFSERATQSSLSAGGAGTRSGPQMLRQAIGDYTEPLWQHGATDAAEAQAWAQQALDDRARRFLRLRGTLLPAGNLRCGSAFDLSGVGRRFSVRYVVSQLEHRFDAEQGLRTQLEAWGAALGEPAEGAA